MKTILTDGQKSIDLNSNDPSVWTFFSGAKQSTQEILYAQVSAAFRAFNLKANTVGNMPFTLNKENGAEYDNSATWENKVGFLPNPSELFRLNTLSYMSTNTIYNVRTTDALGYKVKGLYHAVATNFTPYTLPLTGALDYIERRVGSQIERYQPEDNRLVRMWRLDHTTEVLPSPNTEARAIMNAAGEIYYADLWIKHFYERGGVPPTVIAMKGALSPEKQSAESQSWSDWLRGLGQWRAKVARVFNADALDVKQFGSSVTDLKNNEVYQRAITNIAMGTGMPLSLLMANSANYATAKEEKATWYENDIIPLCNWIAYHYNEQVFKPLGLFLQFHPETLDPQQEDETSRAQAINTFMDFLSKCPTYEVFIGTCETFGYELSDSLIKAAEKYYTDKEAQAEETRQQMQGAGVVLSPDGKPVAQAQPAEDTPEDNTEDAAKSIKANETSSMIALRIPLEIRKEIKLLYPFVDAETLENLHVTIVYLGDNRTLDKMNIVRAVSDVGMYQSPIKGKLQGLARFVNGAESDPLVVTFDSPQMPGLYRTVCGALDNYHVPYHKDHGFIPHMTLAYIPADAEMPIDTIEPLEINFSEVHYVDGNVWYPVSLTGYDNKSAKWIPNLDQIRELQRWQELAFRKFKRGDDMAFEWRNDTLPDEIYKAISANLPNAKEESAIKQVFDMAEIIAAPVEVKAQNDILKLAEALNRLADIEYAKHATVN